MGRRPGSSAGGQGRSWWHRMPARVRCRDESVNVSGIGDQDRVAGDPIADLRGVAAELSSYLKADRVVMVSFTRQPAPTCTRCGTGPRPAGSAHWAARRHDRHSFPEVVASEDLRGNDFGEVVPIKGEA